MISAFSGRKLPRHLACLLGAGLLLGAPSLLPAQSVEERDVDEPAEDRSAAAAEALADIPATVRSIAAKTNRFRERQGLPPVHPNEQLNVTARDFADFMARTGKYGHLADGQRPSERAAEHGYDYCIVAENIAYRFRSTGFSAEELAKRFYRGWKNSPEHRKNMLDPDVTEFGLAVARKGDSPEYFGVQLFGRPKSKSITFRLINELDDEVKYTVDRRGDEKTFSLSSRTTRIHRRCRPTTISLADSDTVIKVENEARYAVVRSEDGKHQLRRVE